ncbi:MAG: alpha/beta fold hydrolase [Chloroflexi bacterium]|nr:alpha/beta fold hydrolase [Chloroflexota bacterium]
MDIDLELYRHEIRVSTNPLIRLSAIDIAPDRPQWTMVFIHGFGGQASQWKYQLRKFGNANRVVALDLRGHGQSGKPTGDYMMAEIQKDLETALDVLGVKGQFVLIGHSFGGAIVTEYAAHHPDRIAQLILVASSGEYKIRPLFRFVLSLPVSVISALTPLAGGKLSAPPHVLKPMHENTLSRWNGWSMFRSLTVPTTIIRGHRDDVFERTHFEEVTRAIPGSNDEDIGSSGHMVMLERREAVNRAIERALEEPKKSWRDPNITTDTTARAALVRERPWLAHYDDGVPFTVAVPRVPLHHFLRSAARRFPLNIALNYEGAWITYRRLNQESNRFANALRSLGVDKGDRVMLLLPNVPQMVTCFYGTLKAGAAAVFTLPITETDELVRQVRDSDAKVLVTLTKFGDVAREVKRRTGLSHVIFANAGDYLPPLKYVGWKLKREKESGHQLGFALEPGMHLLNRILYTHSGKSPEVQVGPDDLAVIQYTSGTINVPKGVMLSHRNLVANTLQTRHWLPASKEGRERFLCCLPFVHAYGMTTALNCGISLGATLILKPTFEVTDVLKTIKSERPTIFPGIPGMYVAINNFPGARKYGISSIKACLSGSAPLPVEVQESFERLTRGRLVEGYGLTEASPVTHANPLNGLRKVGSIGIPLPSTEAKIVDLASGKDVPPGQIGELAIHGPQVMLGYWGKSDDSRRILTSDGWLLTGDVARMDEEGYFQLIARKAEMWYPAKAESQQPAFPRDVEEVLFEVPQVKEAAVVAIANQPIAFVISQKERPTADSLIAYCKRRLPPELVPRLVIFVDDFPRSFIGKVLRRELARKYEEGER